MLAGGIAFGLLGPETARLGKDLFATPFLGSFVAMSAIAVVAMGVESRVRIPIPSAEGNRSGGRRLRAVARQPAFVVAVLASALGYGVMNLLMAATPLAMSFCDYPFAAAAMVNAAGWERMNLAALPFLALVALTSLWLMARRRRARAASSRSPTSART